jgi:methionine sulfoxide reductase heme-binding subunit
MIKRFIQGLLWLPAIIILIAAWTGNLTINPIQAAVQRTGLTAIVLLGLSLACTPLKMFTGWPILSSLRKIFGLYAFYYATIHLLLFVVVDYGLDVNLLITSVADKPFILVGLAVFLILSAMAATSNKWSKARLGRNWKRLHQLLYLAAPLAGLHFAWSLKGDIFRLSGNIFWPLVYLLVITILLVLRVPAVKQKLFSYRPPVG